MREAFYGVVYGTGQGGRGYAVPLNDEQQMTRG